MSLVLDTHVLLWFLAGDSRLPAGWRTTIVDPLNTVRVSVASVWETVIKHALGKLPFPEPPHILLPRECRLQNILLVPITEATVTRLAGLPPLHRDPFDRVIVATTLEHGSTRCRSTHWCGPTRYRCCRSDCWPAWLARGMIG